MIILIQNQSKLYVMNENPETPCNLGYSAIIRRLSSVGDRLPYSHKHIKVSAVGKKMTFKNNSDGGTVDSEDWWHGRHLLLTSGCLLALIIGSYLSWNVLWHLKVRLFYC